MNAYQNLMLAILNGMGANSGVSVDDVFCALSFIVSAENEMKVAGLMVEHGMRAMHERAAARALDNAAYALWGENPPDGVDYNLSHGGHHYYTV